MSMQFSGSISFPGGEPELPTYGDIPMEGLPFEPAPWGDHHGQIRDQSGVLWMVNAAEG